MEFLESKWSLGNFCGIMEFDIFLDLEFVTPIFYHCNSFIVYFFSEHEFGNSLVIDIKYLFASGTEYRNLTSKILRIESIGS